KPMMRNETYYLGLVVKKRGGSLLSEAQVNGRPSVHDLATLLGKAMRQPLMDRAHRPRRLHLRGHRQWQELFPHLEELGINVTVRQDLPKGEPKGGNPRGRFTDLACPRSIAEDTPPPQQRLRGKGPF